MSLSSGRPDLEGRGAPISRRALLHGACAVAAGAVIARDGWAAEAAKRVEVRFSERRGVKSSAFDLSLRPEVEGLEVRYTTDGRPPSASHGTTVTGPVRIAATTVVRAAPFKDGKLAGEIETHSYLFPADIVKQSADGLPPVDWPFEWGDNRVDFGMDPRVVNDPRTRDEFVQGLTSIPVVSVVMDLADLFDARRGIYSNAQKHGRAWERPCSVEMICSDGRPGFQIDAGIRIRGGFSRMPNNAKHSFRLFFRKEYGKGKLKYPLFGEAGAKEFDGIDLRTSQNYSWSMGGDPRAVFFRDILSRDLQLAMGQPSARSEFIHLFLNGQYWGLYNTCERPEASFGASYFGGAKEDFDVLKARDPREEGGPFGGGETPYATDGNRDAWRKLWEAARGGLGRGEAYQRLLGQRADGSRDPALPVLLDPANLTDYMLAIYYAGNFDSPVSKFGGNNMPNNWFGMRSRRNDGGFKFFVWDAEHTLLDVDEDRTGPFPCGDRFEQSNPQWLFQQCLENESFRKVAAGRVERHLGPGGALTPERVKRAVERRVKEIESAVLWESARWGDAEGGFGFGGGSGTDAQGRRAPRTREEHWRVEVRRILEDYVPHRSAVLVEQLWAMGLVANPDALSGRTGASKGPR